MSVATKTPRQEELELPRQLPRALMKGTVGMIAEGKTYLPQHKEESDPHYKTRLSSTTLYNGYSDTVKKQNGKLFSKDIIINDDVPSQIAELTKNIDGQGRNITSFSFDCERMAIVDGISFIYVDFPPITTNEQGFATSLDREVQGARPSSILINSEQILGLKTANIQGVQQLTEIRILEQTLEENPDDEYSELLIEQVRLLTRGGFEIWRQDKSIINPVDNWVLYSEGTTSIDYIPIIPVYTNRVGFMEGAPPLLPLAELNKEHWVSSSEQRNALTYARFAMVVLTGVNPDAEIGAMAPNAFLKLPAGATASPITTSGTGIEQGFIDLDKIEERMRQTSMTSRVQTATGQTATEANINSEDSNCALLAIAGSLEDSLNKMLEIYSDYMGLPSGGTVTVYKGFGEKAPQGTLQELQAMRVQNTITHETLLAESVRRGILPEDFDIKQEVRAINDAGFDNPTGA